MNAFEIKNTFFFFFFHAYSPRGIAGEISTTEEVFTDTSSWNPKMIFFLDEIQAMTFKKKTKWMRIYFMFESSSSGGIAAEIWSSQGLHWHFLRKWNITIVCIKSELWPLKIKQNECVCFLFHALALGELLEKFLRPRECSLTLPLEIKNTFFLVET